MINIVSILLSLILFLGNEVHNPQIDQYLKEIDQIKMDLDYLKY